MIREFFSLQFYDCCQFFLSLVLSSKKIRRKDERAEYFGLYSVAQACIDKHEGHISARYFRCAKTRLLDAKHIEELGGDIGVVVQNREIVGDTTHGNTQKRIFARAMKRNLILLNQLAGLRRDDQGLCAGAQC